VKPENGQKWKKREMKPAQCANKKINAKNQSVIEKREKIVEKAMEKDEKGNAEHNAAHQGHLCSGRATQPASCGR